MKITVATGARSEWGVLEPLVQGFLDDWDIDLSILITGSHLSPEFGEMPYSLKTVEAKRLDVEMLLSSDTSKGTAKSIGLGLVSFADALSVFRPDLLVIEGDRYEMFALAVCAYAMRIPIAHISCGDVTKGSLDDGYRDCITRLSALQFTETEQALHRVEQIVGCHGDSNPCFAKYVGCLSLDVAIKKEVSYLKGCHERGSNYDFLMIIHPSIDYREILDWLPFVLDKLEANVLLSRPNADAGGREINQRLEHATQQNRKKWFWFDRMYEDSRSAFLQKIYLSRCVIGNSSAGIVEAPFLGTPTINIGHRQEGRPVASSIIQAEPTAESIQAAIVKLQSDEFQASLRAGIQLEYVGGNVVERIISHIKEFLK